MAEELRVIVEQEPGAVRWNFEQLKAGLAEMMSGYEGMVYGEDTIPEARKDLASLRKLREAVEDKRKEIRRKCLEPYEAIEEQARQLTTLIDKPIEEISGQVKAYDAKRKEERRNEILAYMGNAFSDLPDKVSQKLQQKTYDKSWENATAAKKTWQEAIAAAHDAVRKELDALSQVDEDFQDAAMKVYGNDLSLVDALEKVNELQRQKEMLRQKELERARQKEEAERRAAEERERRAAEERAAMAEEERPEPKYEKMAFPIEEPESGKRAATMEPKPNQEEGAVLKIRGSRSQISRICGYVTHVGATYEIIRG